MPQANLEFRKIPSLKFLYEVNGGGTKIRNARSKRCHHRRHRIFDYDVIYRNAETGHSDHDTGKEQSTKYLVGTTDRWNDSKQAEEKDRVKHL